MNLAQLNVKYYNLFSDLYAARTFLSKRQYDTMCNVLENDYRRDVQDYLDEQLLVYGVERYERKFRVACYTPRRFLFWRNKIAKQLLKQYRAEFSAYLAALSEQTKETLPAKKEQ